MAVLTMAFGRLQQESEGRLRESEGGISRALHFIRE